MTSRTLLDRLASPAGFALALLLFLLPFITVSCEASLTGSPARVDATFTGVDLLVGGSPELSAQAGQGFHAEPGQDVVAQVDAEFSEYYPPQPLAILAALSLLMGLVAALVLPALTRAWSSVAAAALATVLLAIEVLIVAPARFTSAMEAEVKADDFGLVSYSTVPGVGFFLCAVVLVALAVWQARQAVRLRASSGQDGGPWPDSPEPPA
jgi:hypothetical protein